MINKYIFLILMLPSIGFAHVGNNLLHFHFEGVLILIFFVLFFAKILYSSKK